MISLILSGCVTGYDLRDRECVVDRILLLAKGLYCCKGSRSKELQEGGKGLDGDCSNQDKTA